MQYIKLPKTKKIVVPDTVGIRHSPSKDGLILSRSIFQVHISNELEEEEAQSMIDRLLKVEV